MRKIAFLVCLLACAAADAASPTATLLKARLSSSAEATTGVWLANFSKAKAYATSEGVPFIAVWSNGDSCGHCTTFETACNSAYFKNWMKSSGCVFFFTYPGDSKGNIGGTIFHWCRKNVNTAYPFVRIYWPDGGVDVATVGDKVDGKKGGKEGGQKVAAFIKSKCSKYFNKTTVVKPYTVEFNSNGGMGEMDDMTTKVGAVFTLPANAFTYPDYSFVGWSKTTSGAVAYKNKASVRNLTTVSNGVVTLYAKWKRTTFHAYVGFKNTISMTDLKGWTPNKKVTGMTWNTKKGKWTGKPTKTGTFTIKFTKNKSTTTRKVVVEKDSVIFADETALDRVFVEGEVVELDLSPASYAGSATSVTVTGLPPGLGYADGVITGRIERVGTFNVTVTIVSAAGQKITRTVSMQVDEAEASFCVGTFNGFIGLSDSEVSDPLYLDNRGTFTMSAPSNAHLSATIVTAKKDRYALTGTNWTANGDGTYTANLSTADGANTLTFTVGDETLSGKALPCGVFETSDGAKYEVRAQRSPFTRDGSGRYVDPLVAANANKFVGDWYFKVAFDESFGGVWRFRFTTAEDADLTLKVSEDGTAKIAGKIGSYTVSASSTVFVFEDDVTNGFVSTGFMIPVSGDSDATSETVTGVLQVWLRLWFDRDNGDPRVWGGERPVGNAVLEPFE